MGCSISSPAMMTTRTKLTIASFTGSVFAGSLIRSCRLFG